MQPKSGGGGGAKSKGHFPTINPATEQVLSHIAHAGETDVNAAVKAARRAFPKWAALSGAERGKYLFRIARRIQERSRELAILETLNGGKPIRESRDVDLPLAAQHFFYHAGWADKLQYALGTATLRVASDSGSRSKARHAERGGTLPQPIGVCAQIIPWNFPLLMAAWKIALPPSLAATPSSSSRPETTSLTALRLAEIFQEVDLPPGVVNIITGAGETGAALVNHPDVDKIAFTGSTEVGKRIAKAVASTHKNSRSSSAANLPTSSSPMPASTKPSKVSSQESSSTRATFAVPGSRLFVLQESIVDEVVAKLQIRMASIRVGDPMDKNTDLGAINSRMQLDKIEQYLTAGAAEGAKLHVSGVGSRVSGLGSEQESLVANASSP